MEWSSGRRHVSGGAHDFYAACFRANFCSRLIPVQTTGHRGTLFGHPDFSLRKPGVYVISDGLRYGFLCVGVASRDAGRTIHFDGRLHDLPGMTVLNLINRIRGRPNISAPRADQLTQ